MDIWVATNESNAGKIVAALEEFGFAGTGMTPELFLGPDKITQMGNPPLRIEILTTISGIRVRRGLCNAGYRRDRRSTGRLHLFR